MRTRLWANPATPAATEPGPGDAGFLRAGGAARPAHLRILAFAAAALLVLAATLSLLDRRRMGTGSSTVPYTLIVATVAAALSAGSWLAVRWRPAEPDDTPRHAVPDRARILPLTGSTSLVGSERLVSLVAAVDQVATELDRSRRAVQLLRNSPDLTVALDADGAIIEVSPASDTMLGRPAAWMSGKSLAALVHPEDRAGLEELRSRPAEPGKRLYQDIRLSHLHGHWVPTEVTSLDLPDRARGEWTISIRDVSDRKAHEEHLVRQALYDPLTGLANRALFREHVEKALARLRRTPARPHAVLFVDLDGFKTVNDSLGHAAGDEVLAEVGIRLGRWMRPGDTVARLGGDEFGVLLENTSRSEVGVLAKRILEVLLPPIIVLGKEVVLTGSIGVALSEPGQDSDTLLRNADTAMYTAKASGKGQYRMFEPEMHHAALRRLDLEADLRGAVGRHELYLAYQPIFDLNTCQVTAVEVLARWMHPERGLIPPMDFIAVAEDSGYIRHLGRHILEQACRQVRQWHRDHPAQPPLRICVNVSVRQIEHPDYVDEVARVLADSGLEGSDLTLEITESLFMSDLSATVEKLRRLKDLGLTLAVDDFGTGYSSLSYLRSLPIDVLKIDKSFVVGVTHGPEQAAVAQAVVKLARTFNLRTVAEGIEQPEQAAQLLQMGADMGQGYWYSWPLPAEAMGRFLAAEHTTIQVPPLGPPVHLAQAHGRARA